MLGNWVELRGRSLNGFERNKLYRNTGNKPLWLEDHGYLSGSDTIGDARGQVALDVDGDGRLDLVLRNFEQPSNLLINHSEGTGNWFALRLRGTRCNRDAIGAVVEVQAGGRRLLRQVTTTEGYMAGRALGLHFGLGAAELIDLLRIRWPDGSVSERRDLAVNRRELIVQD